ncbi:MAG: hypothetical protein NT070_12245 [Cyanobacteria bacterium]|nr:hypothetical protein [Cyanobacteriota bacterium]
MTNYNTIVESNNFIALEQYSNQELAKAYPVKSPCPKSNTNITATCC